MTRRGGTLALGVGTAAISLTVTAPVTVSMHGAGQDTRVNSDPSRPAPEVILPPEPSIKPTVPRGGAASQPARSVPGRRAQEESSDAGQRSQVDVTVKPIPRLEPGTVVDEPASGGWSDVLVLSKPRIGAGDVDRVPSVTAEYAKMLNLVIMARVVQSHTGRRKQYHLAKVGIGFALPIRGKQVVVSSQTQEELGAGLDWIARRVLKTNESKLRVRQVAKSRSMLIFDLDAIMLRREEHRWMVMRHAVFVSPERGLMGTLVWLLDRNDKGEYLLMDPAVQQLPPGTVDDRVLNAKADKLFLGIPAEDAFGIVKIPQGKPIKMDPPLRDLAAISQFDVAAARAAERELWRLWKK